MTVSKAWSQKSLPVIKPEHKAAARALIHGMPMEEWKATRQKPATEEQIAAMEASIAKNA